MGRRRSSSLPQPIAVVTTLLTKPSSPGPISCTSSPGSTGPDFDVVSSSSMDDSPLYTPVLPPSPVPHTLPSGFQMVHLHEHPSPLNEAFQSSKDVGSTQVCPLSSVFYLLPTRHCQASSAPLNATLRAYAPTGPSSDLSQQLSFTDINLYPTSLEMMAPYTDWACGAPCELCPAVTAPPQSRDTGPGGPFGLPPLLIPFTPKPTTSTFDELPAAFWGADYTEAAKVQAMFGGAPGLTAVIPEAIPVGYDYNMPAAQLGLDEVINVS
jgi:hypothetical protein